MRVIQTFDTMDIGELSRDTKCDISDIAVDQPVASSLSWTCFVAYSMSQSCIKDTHHERV